MDLSHPALEPTLTALLADAQAALDPAPARAVIIPGNLTPWDCEQVWVRLINLMPVYNQGTTDAGRCGPLEWNAVVGVGVIRCIKTLDDRGNPPKPAQMTADALGILRDAEALESALECAQSPYLRDRRLVQYDTQGAEGAYAGGEWTVRLRITNYPAPCN